MERVRVLAAALAALAVGAARAEKPYYGKHNPPPWWLINLGPIMATLIVLSIVGM